MLSASILLLVPLLVLLLGAEAEAHVVVDPKVAPANGYVKLVFRVSHGCDGSPTTKVTLSIPEGFPSVRPQMKPGWKITVKKGKLAQPANLHGKEITEAVNEITWSGGNIPDEFMDEFGVSVRTPDRTGDVAFSILQTCKKGSMNWAETAPTDHSAHMAGGATGHQASSKFPAAVLTLEKTPDKK